MIMASFVERNGRITVYVRKGQYKYKPVTRTFTKKTVAKKWAAEVEQAIERGEFVDGRNARGVLVTELIDRYEEEISKQKGASTYKREASRLDRLRHMFDNTSLLHLTIDKTLGEFRTMLSEHSSRGEPYSRSTVRKHMQDLMNVLSACLRIWNYQLPYGNVAEEARKRLVQMNMLSNYDLERDTRLGDMDYERIRAYKHARPNTLYKWVALFAIEAGMRRGEIQNMQWAKVNWHDRVYHLEGQKSDHTRRRFKKGRDIPLTNRALAILRLVRVIRSRSPKRLGYIWPWVDGKAMYSGVKRLYEKLGIENTTFHDLRHEFGGHAVESNIDVRLVGAALGHASLKSTHRYTKSKGRNVADIFNELTKKR